MPSRLHRLGSGSSAGAQEQHPGRAGRSPESPAPPAAPARTQRARGAAPRLGAALPGWLRAPASGRSAPLPPQRRPRPRPAGLRAPRPGHKAAPEQPRPPRGPARTDRPTDLRAGGMAGPARRRAPSALRERRRCLRRSPLGHSGAGPAAPRRSAPPGGPASPRPRPIAPAPPVRRGPGAGGGGRAPRASSPVLGKGAVCGGRSPTSHLVQAPASSSGWQFSQGRR